MLYKKFVINSLLLLIVCISITDSIEDICSTIIPNNRYKGIGIYRYWYRNGSEFIGDSHHIYANGKEWEIRLDIDEQNRNSNISFVKLYKNIKRDLLIRFSLRVLKPLNKQQPYIWYRYRCRIFKTGNKIEIELTRDSPQITSSTYYDKNSQFDAKNSIVFNPNPESISNASKAVVVVLERNSREIQFYSTENRTLYNESGCEECLVPVFVRQIDKNLSIDAITDYDIDGRRGHLLVFNVNGVLKYCITPEGEDLTDRCKTENLKTFAEQCFPEDIPHYGLIIILILVIILIVILLIGICFYLRKSGLNIGFGKHKSNETVNSYASEYAITTNTETDRSLTKRPIHMKTFKSLESVDSN